MASDELHPGFGGFDKPTPGPPAVRDVAGFQEALRSGDVGLSGII